METGRLRFDTKETGNVRFGEPAVLPEELEKVALPRGQQGDFLRSARSRGEVVLSPIYLPRSDEAIVLEAVEMVGQGASGNSGPPENFEKLDARLPLDGRENPLSERGAPGIMIPPPTGSNRGQNDPTGRQSVEAR